MVIVFDKDQELYKAFLDGDQSSFDRLMLYHRFNLIYFIQRYIKDPYIAEDISQDVFAYILINKHRYNFKSSFKTFMCMLAKNRAIDYLRKHQNAIISYDEISDELFDENTTEGNVFARFDSETLLEAIKSLNTGYQNAIFLIDIYDLSYGEAAWALKKTQPQVKILIHRARKALKQAYKKEGIEA